MEFEGTAELTYVPICVAKSDTVIVNIEFMLKYDDLNLDILDVVCHKIEEQELLN